MILTSRKLHTIVCAGMLMLCSFHAKAQVAADFTANNITGCAPIVVQFTDLSTGNPTQWHWDLGNGTISTLQHPSTTYILPGTYTVSLTVSDAGGSDTKTITGYIQVTPSPQTAFTISDSAGICPPAMITFTNTTTPAGATYNWDFGDGHSSTQVSPTYTYTATGNYTVTLVATNSNGCKKTLSKTIQVVARPQAGFSATGNTGCAAPLTVSFSSSSTGAVAYEWDFGDGQSGSGATPAHTYTAPGSYSVRLIARTSGGCADTFIRSNYVSIGKPTAAFTVNGSPVCAGGSVSFTNGSAGATSYQWIFGDGTPNSGSSSATVNHQFSTTGTFTVTLIATGSNGCKDTVTHAVTVNPKPTAQFTANTLTGCSLPATINFTNGSTGAGSYEWSFGDGGVSTSASPSHTYTATGTFTVKLIARGTNGCADTFSRTIQVADPSAAFTVNNSPVCAGGTISFTNNAPGAASYLWIFGDGGPNSNSSATTVNRQFNTAGTFIVTLIATAGNGCKDTATHTVTVNPKPKAQFTADTTAHCKIPATVSFTNSSTGAAAYEWRFGDNTSSTTTNATHTYNNWGTYPVTLVAIGSNGCRDSQMLNIRVDTPTVTITQNPAIVCAPDTVSFGVTINPATWTVSSYLWDFGDGGTGSGSNPAHLYNDSGTYIVRVIITTVNGCVFSGTRTVIVGRTPDASFTVSPASACVNMPVTFTSTSTGAATYEWSFGDGGTGSAAVVSHAYANQNTYTVRLIANYKGCRDTATGTMNVTGPSAGFTVAYPCAIRPGATFSNTSTNAATYEWDFGDGNGTTATNPPHTYASEGSYTVRLIAIHTGGCRDTVSQNITVYAPPLVDFSSNDTAICKGATAVFTRLTNPSGFTYNWYFGEGAAGNNANTSVSHTYNNSGVFTVRLVVNDNRNSCKDTMIKPSYVRVGAPTADFTGTPLSGCSPLTVNFTDQSAAAAGTSIVSRTWYFGDGSVLPGNSTTPSHTYVSNGRATYTVSLVVTDNSNCRDSIAKIDVVSIIRPTAGFSAPTQACKKQPVSFTNTTTNFAVSYVWDFGDGDSSILEHPTHTYDTAGLYSIRLIAVNASGCADTITGNILINEVIAGFTMSDSVANCPPLIVNFTNTTINGSSYAWDFGNGTHASIASPSTIYTLPGVYTVKLQASGNGCTDSATKTVTVNGPFGTFNYAPTSGCAPVTVQFSSTATNTQTYNWDMNNGITQSTTTGTHTFTYTDPGSYVPVLVLGNGTGCNVAIVGTDTIKVDKIEGDFTFQATALCRNAPVQFHDTVSISGSGNVTREWTFGDGNGSAVHDPVHSYNAPGTYTVRLILRNAGGCADTIIHTVTVNDLPTVAATSTQQAICAGSSAQLQASGADSFSWAPAGSLSCITCSNPVANPAGTTTYTVTGWDANGCVNTDTVTVTVGTVPVLTTSPDTAVCYGTGVQLRASGATNYTWTPAAGLSCTNCDNPIAAMTDTTTYTVIGTGSFGCADTAHITIIVYPLPVMTVTPSQDICAGGSLVLNAGGAASYSWTPATGLSCTSCPDPTATPAVTTTYTVTGTDAHGCSDTAQVTLSVLSVPTVSVPAQGVCPGDSVTLQASGATTYSWAPATGLSCTGCSNPKASPNGTTTYTVIGTVAGGCADTTQTTVTVHTLPTVSAGQDQDICAGTSAALLATGANTYSWTPTTGLSCSNCDNPTATPAASTTYTVTGTDNNGCKNTDTVSVNINQLPPVAIAPAQDSICFGDTITLTASGADTFSWTPAAGLSCTACPDPKAGPAVTTTYIVTGTDTNGCKDTAQAVISVISLPVISAQDRDVCIGDSVQLQASGAGTYSWTPATGLSCTNCADPKASPSGTTTYTVTGMLSTGCSDSVHVTVNVLSLPTVSAGQDQDICAGTSAALLATGANTYSWTPTAGLSCSNCDNPTATPAASTTYTVTGTDNNGCKNTDTVSVNINQLPPVAIAPAQDSICFGDSITLTASGADTFSWTPAAGLSCTVCPDPKAGPVVTTTYIVTGTDTNGCKDTAQAVISVISLPVISAQDRDVCIGDSVQLQASGASTYSWTPATGLSCTNCSNPKASPSGTTTYTVTGMLSTGCSDSVHVTVNVLPLPTVSAGQDQDICAGTSAALQATGASTYSWTPTAGLSCSNCDNPTATPADTTMYVVTGTSAAGCRGQDTVTVNVKPLPLISAGSNQTICGGDTVHLQATGGVSYTWTPAATLSCSACPDPLATPPAPITYTVTGTGANGCHDTARVTVSLYPQPVISGGSNRDICIGDSIRLQATGGVSYSWSPATGLSCVSCADPIAKPIATTTYTLTGTSADGCKDSADITITVHLPPVVTAGSDTAICTGKSTTLTAGGAASYVWTPATGLSCTNCSSPFASPSVMTRYRVIGTSAAGCRDTAEVTVSVLPLPQVTAGADRMICRGDTVRLQAAGAGTYSWSPATGLSCVSCADPVAAPPAPTVYTVTGTDTNGCANTDQVQVQFYPQPPIDAGSDRTICRGDSTTLQATGGVSYTWFPANNLSCTDCPDPVATPANDITYWVRGTDLHGCTDSDRVAITVIQKMPTSAGSAARICSGETAQLHASGGVQYTWLPATGLSCTTCADPTARPDTTTRYQVIIRQSQCFTDTLYQTVAVFPRPTIDLGGDQRIFAGESVRLFANSTYAASYQWSPAEGLSCTDCISPVATPAHTITYKVVVANELGCPASDEITITLKCDQTMLFIPNTFTPNGDGQNDRFFPHANGITHVDRFRVYNRWGELIFDMSRMPVNDPAAGWDGTFKGQVLKPDTYVYIVQATCINGEPVEVKGDISLIR